jgi:hypothetical protein
MGQENKKRKMGRLEIWPEKLIKVLKTHFFFLFDSNSKSIQILMNSTQT